MKCQICKTKKKVDMTNAKFVYSYGTDLIYAPLCDKCNMYIEELIMKGLSSRGILRKAIKNIKEKV